MEFRYRNHCQLDLLVDGKCFFPRILERIAEAEQAIMIELYLVESGQLTQQFIEALTQASQRGVQIGIIVDDIGARDFQLHEQKQLVANRNIELRSYNPLRFKKGWRNIYRDHRKLIIIDYCYGFIGGAGIADSFIECEPSGQAWHDIMVELTGPIMTDMVTLFNSTWQRLQGRMQLNMPNQSNNRQDTEQASLGSGVRLQASEGLGRSQIKKAILNHINSAVERIWIMNPYFFPSLSIRRALKKAARKGVDVRILLPSDNTDHPLLRYAGHKFYTGQMRSGVKIFEYKRSFLHAKVILCDDWVSVGSYNLDLWSIRWNLEANIESHSTEFVAAITAMIRYDQKFCEQYELLRWQQRPKLKIMRENMAWALGRMMMLLDRPKQTS